MFLSTITDCYWLCSNSKPPQTTFCTYLIYVLTAGLVNFGQIWSVVGTTLLLCFRTHPWRDLTLNLNAAWDSSFHSPWRQTISNQTPNKIHWYITLNLLKLIAVITWLLHTRITTLLHYIIDNLFSVLYPHLNKSSILKWQTMKIPKNIVGKLAMKKLGNMQLLGSL